MVKAKYFGCDVIEHPSFNPNPISRYYAASYQGKTMMLTTINVDDKVYISSLINDNLPNVRPEATRTLTLLSDGLISCFYGNIVFCCNSQRFVESLIEISYKRWSDTNFDDATINTNDYNKNYSFLFKESPITIECDDMHMDNNRSYSSDNHWY